MSNYTEKEAEIKWCPMVRIGLGPQDANWQGMAYNNRYDIENNKAFVTCIGSRCMMWQGSENTDADGVRRGYCGLARQR